MRVCVCDCVYERCRITKYTKPSQIIAFICYIMVSYLFIFVETLHAAVWPLHCFVGVAGCSRVSFFPPLFKTPAHNRIIHFMKTHNQILNTPKYVTRMLKSIYRPILNPVQKLMQPPSSTTTNILLS